MPTPTLSSADGVHLKHMVTDEPSIRLVLVTTVPETLRFFRGQLRYLQDHGIQVSVVSSPGPELAYMACREGTNAVAIKMSRAITPVADLVALARLIWMFWLQRPDIVHAHTPKAGLLAMIAAWLSRVPVRAYTVHGLPFVTQVGLLRWILRMSERVSISLANAVYAVSTSLRENIIEDGLCHPECIKVLANGSVNGVDGETVFNPANYGSRAEAKQALGVPSDALVVGYVGRLVRDKGIEELHRAWMSLREEYAELHLVLVGKFEEKDPVPRAVRESLLRDTRVHYVGFVDEPAPYYAAMDILVLPSRREGLGMVALEAAAMEVPVVATQIAGCVDSVLDGTTGTLVPPQDSSALTRALRQYLENPQLRRVHGENGRQRVLREFHPKRLWQAIYREYSSRVTGPPADPPRRHHRD